MSRNQNPKQRHHHVWQHYLKPWTSNGGIWCRHEGRIFRTGTSAVAVEREFYRLHKLTADDINVVRTLFSGNNPISKESHAQFVNKLMAPFRLVKLTNDPAINAAVEQLLDNYASEVLEDFHSDIERRAIPLLSRALRGDLGFYNDEHCVEFLYFISTQFMRTKGIKERMLETVNTDLSRLWNILIHMFAENIGLALYLERDQRKLILIRNRTDIEFITGDQPLVNLKAQKPRWSSPDQLSIYYPIGPWSALLLTEVDEDPTYPAEGLTPQQVLALNTMLAESCYQQVFAHSEASLSALTSPS